MSSEPIISLRVLTPEGAILEIDELTSVNVPLVDGGNIGIKPGHAPLIAETTKGTVRYQMETGQNNIELHPGVLDIRYNLVLILTAGELSQTPEMLTQPAETDYERLMKTLVRELYPDTEIDNPTS